MSEKIITVWDPGMTSGFVQALVTPDEKPRIIDKVELPGGLDAVIDLIVNGWIDTCDREGELWVAEKFRVTPRTFRAAEVEALRIEGAIELAHGMVTWQYNDSMLLAGAGHGSPSKNKTAADNVLRSMGLWTLPSEVNNHPDANDINSAMKHLVAYLRNSGHEPTIEAIHDAVM